MDKLTVEEIHKELDLVQGCITRMAQNSFLVKGWLVTLFAVILALLPERVNGILLSVVMSAVTGMMWYLDAFFLRTERDYRRVYEWVIAARPAGNRKLLYQLNVKLYQRMGGVSPSESIGSIMRSRTLLCFYGVPMGISLAYLMIQLAGS